MLPWSFLLFTSFSHQPFKTKKESLRWTRTILVQYLYTDQILFDSSQKCPLWFFFQQLFLISNLMLFFFRLLLFLIWLSNLFQEKYKNKTGKKKKKKKKQKQMEVHSINQENVFEKKRINFISEFFSINCFELIYSKTSLKYLFWDYSKWRQINM